MFDDSTEPKFSLDELMGLRAPGIYLVRADGDSMTGVGIFDKDLMVVDKGRDAENGNVIIAAVNNEPLVKIYHREPGGQVILHSANPKYPPRFILESESFWIWGVVVNSVRMHGKY